MKNLFNINRLRECLTTDLSMPDNPALSYLSVNKSSYWKPISFILLVLILFTGCKEEIEPQENVSEYKELVIGTTRINTRALDDAFEPYDEIGIFAIHGGTGNLLYEGNYADNIPFDLQEDGITWRADEPIYFAPDGSPLDLIAYYPYEWDPFKEEGSTNMHFRVERNQSNYQEYTNSDLAISHKWDVEPTTQKVNLTFDHQLSQITFALRAGEGFDNEEFFDIEYLKEAEITLRNVIVEGKIDLANGNANDVEPLEEREDVIPYIDWEQSEGDPSLIYGAKVIIIPQELNEESAIEIRLGDRTFTRRFYDEIQMESGESRLFTITLNNREMEISTKLNPWNYGDPVEMDVNEDLPEIDEENAMILEITFENDAYPEFYFYSTSEARSELIIDWGDGSKLDIYNGILYDGISHRYPDSGTYEVKISGKSEHIKFESDKITKIKQWGDLKIKSWAYSFAACEGLYFLPPHMPDAEDFTMTFFACFKLKNLPEGLFDRCISAKSFEMTFSDCVELESIPEGLFKNNREVTNFEGTFAYCRELKEIPKDIFMNCEKVVTFSNTFEHCESITSIPADIFDDCINVTNFEGTFMECISLTGKTPNTNGIEIWDRHLYPLYPSEINSNGCFYNCVLLENYDLIPEEVKY